METKTCYIDKGSQFLIGMRRTWLEPKRQAHTHPSSLGARQKAHTIDVENLIKQDPSLAIDCCVDKTPYANTNLESLLAIEIRSKLVIHAQ